MNIKKITITALFFIIGVMIAFSQSNKTNLTVKIKGFRNNNGQILIVLFNKEDGFPEQNQNAILKLKVKIKNKQAEAVIKDLNFGDYAISIIHDENYNDQLDISSGRPTEGTGFSNNPVFTSGPASFDESKIILNKRNIETTIKVIYL